VLQQVFKDEHIFGLKVHVHVYPSYVSESEEVGLRFGLGNLHKLT